MTKEIIMQTSYPITGNSLPHARQPSSGRRVTDAPTRMFHWLFALSFVGAYLTAESEQWRLLHVTLGYNFAGLLVFRVLYGVFGPRQSSPGVLWRKLGAGSGWLRSLWAAHSGAKINWRLGQNLLMALTVALMMALVIPLTFSGYASYNDWGDALGGDWLEETHEFFANALLAAATVHMGLIFLLSVLRRQNQAMPMVSGCVPGAGPSPVQNNRGWLAILLLLAVVVFGVWQWQDSPGRRALGMQASTSMDIEFSKTPKGISIDD